MDNRFYRIGACGLFDISGVCAQKCRRHAEFARFNWHLGIEAEKAQLDSVKLSVPDSFNQFTGFRKELRRAAIYISTRFVLHKRRNHLRGDHPKATSSK
jgi:hypothetical protein